jgi:site-specific recombinase XerD
VVRPFSPLFNEFCTERGLTDLTQITPTHVQQFVSASPTNNTHTRHARAQFVKGFLSWCAQDEEMGVREKMVRRIEMPKLEQSDIEIFTDDDIFKLLRACEKMKYPHRNKALVLLLLETSLRLSEVCTILETAIGELGKSLIPIGNAIVRLEERNTQNDRMRTIMVAILAVVVPATITITGWFVLAHH